MWQWQCQQCSSSAAAVQKWARTSGPLGSVLDCACGTGGQVPASLGSAGEQPRVLLALKGGFNHPRALPLHSRLCCGQGGNTGRAAASCGETSWNPECKKSPALPCPALPCSALLCPALHCTQQHCTAMARRSTHPAARACGRQRPAPPPPLRRCDSRGHRRECSRGAAAGGGQGACPLARGQGPPSLQEAGGRQRQGHQLCEASLRRGWQVSPCRELAGRPGCGCGHAESAHYAMPGHAKPICLPI